MKTFIYVTTQFEDMHSYPDAPEEVAFLRTPHRHMFHVKATIEVSHYDRELEFILVKRELDQMCLAIKNSIVPDKKSCERIAAQLSQKLSNRYGTIPEALSKNKYRNIIVEVSEDGENGAVVVRE